MRTVLCAIIVAGLTALGVLDARAGKWNTALTAWLFSAAHGIIFYWH